MAQYFVATFGALRPRLLALLPAVVVMIAARLAGAQDLSGLPDYHPQQPIAGLIRATGNGHMATLMKSWQDGFRKFHPEARFAASLKGTASGIYGLEMRAADIALMGRAVNPFERYGTYERSWMYPVEIEVATGSPATEGKSPALAILVHRDNPLSKLTLRQLDCIFGAQRGGGWKALSWDESSARPGSQNIRTWDQLGVKGRWTGKPIHVYGPPLQGAGVVTFFQTRVFGGGAMWNEDLREYAEPARMLADLANDPYGIAYAPLPSGSTGVKAVALAESAAGPFVSPTRASVTDRSYPLSRPVYIDYTIDNEKSELATPRVDPKVQEFLRYILSRQGQQDVEREGSYAPLPAAVVREQLRKLNSEELPPEKALLSDETANSPVRVRLSVDEDPIVPRLAESLGYLRREGIELVKVRVEDFASEDYLLQAPLNEGQIDAAYHWFNHAVFGARHNLPVTAVMVFNDAPGMTVMVANPLVRQIRSAADFKGRNVAEGAGYGTKSLLTSYLTRRAGLPLHSYTPVMLQQEGRQEAVIQGLEHGQVDVMTFQEPITSALLRTGMVKTLYDLNTRESTTRVLGAPWPAQSLLLSPAYIRAHPDTVQHLVNAFVRTMRFINSHTPEQILDQLPADYFVGKDRQTQLEDLRLALPTFARGDYSLSPAAVKLVVDSIQSYDFDDSEEGRWRRTAETTRVEGAQLYDNRFVNQAMREMQ
jgi:ABC-type nitrate/sulfonate/bicarbonate transport system substrate-binding protein/ABC-type phosphate transport system substrate-binding protein